MANVPNKAVQKAKAKSPAKASAIPEHVKKPNDHQPAKEDVTGPVSTEVEWEGHVYTVDAEALDDAELLEFFTDENFVGALRLLLGTKQWVEYKERARDENGRVKATECAKFLFHVSDEVKRKNS